MSDISAVTTRLWRNLIRVERLEGDRVIVVVPGWDPKHEVDLHLSQIPERLHVDLKPGFRFTGLVNSGADDDQELIFVFCPEREAVINSLEAWITDLDEGRSDRLARLKLGHAPCTGGENPNEIQCSECGEPGKGKGKLGDPCRPCAINVGTVPDAVSVLKYRYDPKVWEGLHDWDGGQCWRCQAYEPRFHEGTGAFAVANALPPCAEIPEKYVRAIYDLLCHPKPTEADPCQ